MQESAVIQKKMDLIDEALDTIAGKRSPAPVGIAQHGPLSLVEAKPRRMLLSQQEGATGAKKEMLPKTQSLPEQSALTKNLGTPVAMLQSESKSKTRSKTFMRIFGLGEDFNEWLYDGPHTTPRRNKVVLALIEMVPPLGIFGMDRLYLGQPVIAIFKVLSFFGTFGLVGSIWAMCDAVVIAQNCILQSKHLDQFGMKADFVGSSSELNIAAAVGILIFVSWFLHIAYIALYIHRETKQGGRFYEEYCKLMGVDGVYDIEAHDAPQNRLVSAKKDPFLSELHSVHSHSLKADPFLTHLPPAGYGDKEKSGLSGFLADTDAQTMLTPQQKESKEKSLTMKPGSSARMMYKTTADNV